MTEEFYTLTQDDANKLAMHGPFPNIDVNSNGSQTSHGVFTLVTTTAAALCQEPDSDADQLLGPLVLAGGRTILVGDTGHGKTTLGFQIIHTILAGQPFLDWHGKGEGRALIIDLEQGRKSVKRGLRDAGLAERDDVDLVLVPDGLSLDQDPGHLRELERVLGDGHYTIVDLDPYYKAHRAEEPNAERPIVDLMRTLDGLRSTYQFALLLPAHPRKDAVGGASIRRLTIHDIAGSGAITRGAEIILAIERVAHGFARLRFLKDREGDLPIDEAWHLVFSKDDGFQRDPKDLAPARDYQAELIALEVDGEWRTIREYMDALKAGDKTLRPILESLVVDGRFEYAQGPAGRHRNAKCWRPTTASDRQMHLNAVDADSAFREGKLTTASSAPPRKGADVDAEVVAPTASPELHPEDNWLDELVATVDLDQPIGTLDP